MATDVFAIGNALVDFVCPIEDKELKRIKFRKGDMRLVKKHPIEIQNFEKYPGGSAANVVAGAANLGIKTSYSSVLGNDSIGEFFSKSLEDLNVKTDFALKEGSTGSVLVLITPDGERTFSVCPGIMYNYKESDLPLKTIRKSRIFHTNFYKLQNDPQKKSVIKGMAYAKRKGLLISLDLSSPEFIEKNRSFIVEFIRKNVDIVFANEDEARALKLPLELLADIAVYKMGEQGSLIVTNKEKIRINAVKANLVNSNGAGDAYIAGFLYGFCRDLDLEKCGNIGSYYAAKVVEQEQARFPGTIRNIEELV